MFSHCRDHLKRADAEPTTVSSEVGTDSLHFPSSLSGLNETTNVPELTQKPKCQLLPANQYLHEEVTDMIKSQRVTLLEYRLHFVNYSVDPLKINQSYSPNRWSRVTTEQGQTLLSLAFNYGVLSMMTLTLGTALLDVDLLDSPKGCMGNASESEQLKSIQYLLMRDFGTDVSVVLVNQERICHEIMIDDCGYAKFIDRCYTIDRHTGDIRDHDTFKNVWIVTLYGILLSVKILLLFFGPVFFISAVKSMAKKRIPYVVKLKDKKHLSKSIVVERVGYAKLDETYPLAYKHVVDLTKMKGGFPRLKEALKTTPFSKVCHVNFKQYDISVDYGRTQMENKVSVGILQTICSMIFNLKIRNVGPFKECCHTNMLAGCGKYPWYKCGIKFAYVFLIFVIPLPYYIRLIIFYTHENVEVLARKQITASKNLRESFNYETTLLHYFTPTHPLFITIYVVYGVTAFLLALTSKKGRRVQLLKMIVNSFRDLETISCTKVIGMAVSNLLWPFQKYGILIGTIVSLFYWIVMIPLTLLIGMIYCCPTIYIIYRLIHYCRMAIFVRLRIREKPNKPYQVGKPKHQQKTLNKFKVKTLLGKYTDTKHDETLSDNFINDIAKDEVDCEVPFEKKKTTFESSSTMARGVIGYEKVDIWHCVRYVVVTLFCIGSLLGCVIILTEVIGCLVEIGVFTIMGIIVNASTLLKYVTLVVLLVVYCCDCFNNVEKKYLKLNKALFGEITKRINKELEEVTGQLANFQENRGFKAQQLDEQNFYEEPDTICVKPRNHWEINDLVLFVDSQDTPRIPKKLFDEICKIEVAGVPGPVYRGQLEAIKQLAKIVFFIWLVFVIVMTFGAIYNVSSTNQMLATMAGGFLPMILKSFLYPPSPDVEIGTVSFKCRMDEIIKNYKQVWPIHDLPFELVPEDGADVPDSSTTAPVDHPGLSKSNGDSPPARMESNTAKSTSRFRDVVMKLLSKKRSADKLHPVSYVDGKMEVDILILVPEQFGDDSYLGVD